MTVIEVKENGAIRTKMLSCDSPFCGQPSDDMTKLVCLASTGQGTMMK